MNLYFPSDKTYNKPESRPMAFSELSQAITAIKTKHKPVVFLD